MHPYSERDYDHIVISERATLGGAATSGRYGVSLAVTQTTITNKGIQMTESTKPATVKVPRTAKTAPYGYGVAPLANYKTSTGEARGLGWLVFTSKTKEACQVKAARKIPAGVAWVILSFAQGVGNGPAERAGIVLGSRKGTKAFTREGKSCAVPDALKGIIIKPAKPDGRQTDKQAGKSTAKPTETRKVTPEPVAADAAKVDATPDDPAEVKAQAAADVVGDLDPTPADGQMYRDAFAQGLMTRREANKMLSAIGADLLAPLAENVT